MEGLFHKGFYRKESANEGLVHSNKRDGKMSPMNWGEVRKRKASGSALLLIHGPQRKDAARRTRMVAEDRQEGEEPIARNDDIVNQERFYLHFRRARISGLRAFPAEKKEASLWEASLFSCQNRTT